MPLRAAGIGAIASDRKVGAHGLCCSKNGLLKLHGIVRDGLRARLLASAGKLLQSPDVYSLRDGIPWRVG